MGLKDLVTDAAKLQGDKAFVVDIMDLFKQVYGTKPMVLGELPQEPSQSTPFQVTTPASVTKKTHTFLHGALWGQDELTGQDIFLPITIMARGKKYSFPYAVISFNRAKRWVETPVTSLPGEVNELISKKSWDITIKGFLIGPLGQFPDDQLGSLNDLFDVDEPVHLICAISDIFLHASDTVIIKEIDLPAKSGVIGVRDFTMKLKSDTIFTLYVD